MDEIQKVDSTTLANFGGRDPIKEMALRVRTMAPNAAHYTDNEAMAIAQLAYAHDLDPFNGEVWGIGSGSNWKGIMVGIKGLRKAAKREADRENSVYWFDVPQLVSAKEYGVEKPGAIAYKMVLRDSATTQAWAKSVNSLTSAGIPYAEAVKMLGGNPPCVIGIGIADPGEPSKMALHARAKKRGEAEALKIRYSIEFRGAGVTVEDEPVDGEAADLPAVKIEPVIEQTLGELYPGVDEPEPVKKSPAELIGDMFGAPDVPSEVKGKQAEPTTPEPRAAGIKIGNRALRDWSAAELKALINDETKPAGMRNSAKPVLAWKQQA